MSALSSTKPDAWTLSPQMTAAPELWRGCVGAHAFWEGLGGPLDFVTNEASTLIGATWGKGSYGVQITSDSSGEYIDAGTSPVSGSQNRTVLVLWRPNVETELSEDFYSIDDGGGGSNGERWTFKRQSADNHALRIEIQGSGYSTSIIPTLNEWHVSACILDGSTLGDHTIYHNGVTEQASGTDSVNTSSTYIERIAGGRIDASGRFLGGDIALCLVWNRAIAVSDLDRIFADPFVMFRPAGF